MWHLHHTSPAVNISPLPWYPHFSKTASHGSLKLGRAIDWTNTCSSASRFRPIKYIYPFIDYRPHLFVFQLPTHSTVRTDSFAPPPPPLWYSWHNNGGDKEEKKRTKHALMTARTSKEIERNRKERGKRKKEAKKEREEKPKKYWRERKNPCTIHRWQFVYDISRKTSTPDDFQDPKTSPQLSLNS